MLIGDFKLKLISLNQADAILVFYILFRINNLDDIFKTPQLKLFTKAYLQ